MRDTMIKKAIFPAAGLGTRFLPATKSQPKEMLPLVVKSISAMVSFAYIRQKEAMGLGHAIFTAKELLNTDPFAVILGDDIIISETPCIKQMIKIFSKKQATIIAIKKVPKSEIHHYGVIEAEEIDSRLFKVKSLVEKPSARQAHSDYAIIGRYILTSGIFKTIIKVKPDAKGEIQLTDAIN